ncbi:MAG: SpoIIE family protein phosphatase [Rhodopirellula sp.]|nr:SpoIIE family protein phosphatase [Rhodopirellula sp.]
MNGRISAYASYELGRMCGSGRRRLSNLFGRSLGRRMAALILVGAGLVLTLVLGYSHFAQRARILANAAREGDALAQSVVYQIQVPLGRAEAVVQQVALFLATEQLGRTENVDLIRRTLEAHPALFGMAVALSETAADQNDFQILYGFRDKGAILVRDRESPLLDYQHDWFHLPYYRKTPVWIEPYYDADARTLMVTYSVPVVRGEEVVAVVTCDLSLEEIETLLDELPLGEGSIAVLLSQRGTFIAHPEPRLIMRETIFSLAESQTHPETARAVHQLGRNMLSGSPGHMRCPRPFSNDMAYMYYRCVPSTGWAFGVFRPEAQVLAPLFRLNKINALVALTGLTLLLIPAMGIAWSVAGPVRRLANAAQRLATGDFDTALPPVRTHDEVAQLTGAFEQMRRDLRRYIADLTATTAAKERIAGELSAAREIQMSIVPKRFPPFPDRPEIDLYALLIPALEVGGDLYDFALLDEDHLYIAIGDVSGKGVPASLLMAVGKTLLKSTVQSVRAPARALAHVNDELAEGNESCMFITMFCGILNLKTGDFIYSNAGHNPPLLARRDGTVERLDDAPGLILGIASGAAYEDHSRRLNAGDLLLLYTDGVTEAMDSAKLLFGDDRLREFVHRNGHQAPQPLLENLGTAVHAHAGSAAQSDDITALAVRYRTQRSGGEDLSPAADITRPTPDATVSFRNDLDELTRLAGWLQEQGSALRIPASLLMSLNLALEEWLINVISYAYGDDDEHRIVVRLWRGRDELLMEIEDDGRPFDPTVQAETDTSLPLEHRPIGGLGIHFIRQTMDRLTYRREGGRNRITMAKSLVGGSA